MPNPSDVGLGWAGSQDYDSYNLWWATEASIDYGVRIQGRGRGDCGTNWTPTGTSVNGAEIFTEGTQYDGTNQTALASIDRLNLQAPIDIRDMMIMSTNQFVAPMIVNSASDGSTLERLRIMITTWSGVDAISTAGSSPNSILRFSVVSGGVNVFDFGFNQQLPCTNVIAFGADGDGFEGSGNVNPTINCFAFNNGANDYVNVVRTTCASEDTTGTLTGFTSTELVDFASNDFRTRATSSLATAGTAPANFVGAFLEQAAGITIPASTTNQTYNSLNHVITTTGGINIPVATTNQDYNSLNHTITTVSQVVIPVVVTNQSYQSLSHSIALIGDINIPVDTTSMSYTANDSTVTLIPPDTVVINPQVTSMDYNALQQTIILQGEITIEVNTTNYTYNAIDSTIRTSGPIPINFRNAVKVQGKTNRISVKRTTNIIRV